MRKRLIWNVRRVLVMAPAEIGYRVVQTLRNSVGRFGFFQASNAPEIVPAALPECWFSLDPPGVDARAVARAADKLIAPGSLMQSSSRTITLSRQAD